MKIYELENFITFYNETKNKNYPLQFSYLLTKIKQEIESDLEYYNNSLNTILQKYAEQENGNYKMNEDKTHILIKPEYLEICKKEMNELLSLDFTSSKTRIPLRILPQDDISPELLEKIFPFIEE